MFTADSMIIDDRTGEIIADKGETLDNEILYRMEHIGYENAITCGSCGFLMDYNSPGHFYSSGMCPSCEREQF